MIESTGRWTEDSIENFMSEATAPSFIASLRPKVGMSYSLSSGVQFELCAEEGRRQAALRIQSAIREVIGLSGFEGAHCHIAPSGLRSLRFTIDDPCYSASIAVNDHGFVELVRPLSELTAFHSWYVGILPSIAPLFLEICAILGDEIIGRERKFEESDRQQYKARPPVFKIDNVAIQYHVRSSMDHSLLAKSEPLRQLMSLMPDPSGRISEHASDTRRGAECSSFEALRADVDRQVTEGYQVTMTPTASRVSLAFVFTYRSGMASSVNAPRPDSRSAEFLSNAVTRESYFGFFRQRCLCGFVASIIPDAGMAHAVSSIGDDLEG